MQNKKQEKLNFIDQFYILNKITKEEIQESKKFVVLKIDLIYNTKILDSICK